MGIHAQLASPNFTGTVTFPSTTEVLNSGTISASVFTADFATGGVFYITTAPEANFTINVTNLPTTDNRVISLSFFALQGETGYYPNVFQIAGESQTIKWIGGIATSPTNGSGKIDIFSFTLTRLGSVWTVFGGISAGYNS